MRRFYRIFILAFTIICYASVLISPADFWMAGFIAMLIPAILCYHLVVFIFHIKNPNKTFFFHLILFFAGFPFIKTTFQLSLSEEDVEDPLKVLSYNVRVFNVYDHLNENYSSSRKMIDWALKDDSPIKCFQEYYNKNDSEIFNVNEKLKSKGWKHFNQRIRYRDNANGEFGQAIFSKYPIVKNGYVKDEEGAFMNSIYSDILINSDTIRVYCVHLESMSIDENNIVDAEKLKTSYKDTGYRLKGGFIARAQQVELLVKQIERSPHPVIVCGDLNELPYSYVYTSLKGELKNAFESKGSGFGFTYNGKLFFLRIDNQFFSEHLEAVDFKTYRSVKFSDHFPISSSYYIK